MSIVEINSEEDLVEARKEIQRLEEVIKQYYNNSFKVKLKNAPKMKIPNNWEPPGRYHCEDCLGIASDYGGKVRTKTLPIIKTWKTGKHTKGTYYVLYEHATRCYIKLYIKDNDPKWEVVNFK